MAEINLFGEEVETKPVFKVKVNHDAYMKDDFVGWTHDNREVYKDYKQQEFFSIRDGKVNLEHEESFKRVVY